MFVAVAAIGGAVVGSMFGGGGGGGSSAPSYQATNDPAIGEAAKRQAEISAQSLEFSKQVYEEGKPALAEYRALTNKVTEDQLAISKENQARARESWERLKSVYYPVIDQSIADAVNIDSEAEQGRLAGEASAGVQRQYGIAQDQSARQMAASGVNPNSGRNLAMMRENALGLATSRAGAANNARVLARDKGIALRAGVSNLASGLPNTASNAYGLAVTSGNAAAQTGSMPISLANNQATLAQQGYGTALQGNAQSGAMLTSQFGTNANIYGNQVNAWQAQQNAQQNANAQSSQGIGSLVGTLGAAYLNSRTGG